jgi:DnaJ-class molecular chaperone
MSRLRIVSDRVQCPCCDGNCYDRFVMAPDGGPERCPACDGSGTVPMSELAELEQWASGLTMEDELPPAA